MRLTHPADPAAQPAAREMWLTRRCVLGGDVATLKTPGRDGPEPEGRGVCQQ
jgi:hypothetical protein